MKSVTLLDLEPHHCRWPVDAPDLVNHRFCGVTREDGLPYCKAHAKRAYRPEENRRLSGDSASFDARVSRVSKVMETA